MNKLTLTDCPLSYRMNLLYSRFRVLNVKDMIQMEFMKFIFKYSNQMLSQSFNKYFIKILTISPKIFKVKQNKTKMRNIHLHFLYLLF